MTRRTARMVAEWQCVGFCHGVLNTDNMSIVGLTIDYGPFGFLDRWAAGPACGHPGCQDPQVQPAVCMAAGVRAQCGVQLLAVPGQPFPGAQIPWKALSGGACFPGGTGAGAWAGAWHGEGAAPCSQGRVEPEGPAHSGHVDNHGPPHPGPRYDPDHVCNASDNAGRYTYSKQPEVCKWNLQKLLEALEPELPRELGEAILAEEFDSEFRRHYLQKMRRKLGLVRTELDDDGALVAKLLETMHLTGECEQAAVPRCQPGRLRLAKQTPREVDHCHREGSRLGAPRTFTPRCTCHPVPSRTFPSPQWDTLCLFPPPPPTQAPPVLPFVCGSDPVGTSYEVDPSRV